MTVTMSEDDIKEVISLDKRLADLNKKYKEPNGSNPMGIIIEAYMQQQESNSKKWRAKKDERYKETSNTI
jgi:hypothetical protein